jgi:hypothetical protein
MVGSPLSQAVTFSQLSAFRSGLFHIVKTISSTNFENEIIENGTATKFKKYLVKSTHLLLCKEYCQASSEYISLDFSPRA